MIANIIPSYDIAYTLQDKTCFTDGATRRYSTEWDDSRTYSIQFGGGFHTVEWKGGRNHVSRHGRVHAHQFSRESGSSSESHKDEAVYSHGGFQDPPKETVFVSSSASYSYKRETYLGPEGVTTVSYYSHEYADSYRNDFEVPWPGTGSTHVSSSASYTTTNSNMKEPETTSSSLYLMYLQDFGGSWTQEEAIAVTVNTTFDNHIIPTITSTVYADGISSNFVSWTNETYQAVITTTGKITRSYPALRTTATLSISRNVPFVADSQFIPYPGEVGFMLTSIPSVTSLIFLSEMLVSFTNPTTLYYKPEWRSLSIHTNRTISEAYDGTDGPPSRSRQTLTLTNDLSTFKIHTIQHTQTTINGFAKQHFLGTLRGSADSFVYHYDTLKETTTAGQSSFTYSVAYLSPSVTTQTTQAYTTSTDSMLIPKNFKGFVDDGSNQIRPLSTTTSYSVLEWFSTTTTAYYEGSPQIVYLFNGVAGDVSISQTGKTEAWEWTVTYPSLGYSPHGYLYDKYFTPIRQAGFCGVSSIQFDQVYQDLNVNFGSNIPQREFSAHQIKSLVQRPAVSALTPPANETFSLNPKYIASQSNSFVFGTASFVSANQQHGTIEAAFSTNYTEGEIQDTLQVALNSQNNDVGLVLSEYFYEGRRAFGGVQSITNSQLTAFFGFGKVKTTQVDVSGGSESGVRIITKKSQSSILPTSVIVAQGSEPYIIASSQTQRQLQIGSAVGVINSYYTFY